ncbi:MAG TPA: tRNA guanosine(34) transglycosylase Tgt [Candidatus Paceibacterota bacterium]
MAFFKVTKQSKKSRARVGVITTKHGSIKTPAFVPVATKGTLKTIPPNQLKEIGVQVAFVNTFHLTAHPGVDVIKKFGGIHKYAKLDIPLMSDSAGFQVFSLGEGKQNKAVKSREGDIAPLEKIEEKGVRFRSPRDGKLMVFTPEISMQNQRKIGADIIMAFDECIYYGASHEYTKQATERTHRWLLRCIKAKKSKNQYLYGIIQGGVFRNLRQESASFVTQQDTPGVAIGGVAIGESKKEIREQLSWVAPYLPEKKPVHLLGIGQIDDILDAVRYGVDTFDCVEPTRLARNGIVYTKKGNPSTPSTKLRTSSLRVNKNMRIDVGKGKYVADKNPIQRNCKCYTCQNFSLSFIHHLFKERELLGYYLTSYHNLHFFADFFADLRSQITAGKL